jgi:Spy/CpxP family protein refolding chaperone
LRRILLAAALAALFAAPAARAQMPDGKWWKNPRMTADLNLTAEQSDEIEKIFVRSRVKLIDLKADLEKKQLDLQEAMQDKTANRAAVEKKIESVENARATLQKTRALMILDMKQVLKPEQWDRLLQKTMERREMMRERMQEQRRMMREEGPPPQSRPQNPRPQGRRPNG